jgi:type VI secretion system secreted protein Hcp
MAVDMFLKIDTVEGESQDVKHTREIDVLSWSWGMTQSGSMQTATGGGSGKVNVNDVSITKWIDTATPVLMEYCCMGKHFDRAVLTVRKAGTDDPVEYMKLEMKNVMVSSMSSGASGGSDRVTEHVTLNFSEYKMTYTEQTDTGDPGKVIPQSWDIRRNTLGTL